MSTPTIDAPVSDPPIDAPADHDDAPRWVRKRRPVLIALAVVAVVWLVLTGLRMWGPVNPDVRVVMQTTFEPPADNGLLELANDSWAGIEIVDVRVIPDPQSSSDLVMPTASKVSIHPPGDPSQSFPIPYHLAGNSKAVVDVELRADGCQPMYGVRPSLIEVEYRTMSGRTVPVHDAFPFLPPVQSCPAGGPLPTGEPPADRDAATAAVRTAFEKVYAAGTPMPERLAQLDETTRIEPALTALASGPLEDAVAVARADVLEISFDRPDHAWVRYRIAGHPVLDGAGERVGTAHLIDGQWKVSRNTYCGDLILAGVSC